MTTEEMKVLLMAGLKRLNADLEKLEKEDRILSSKRNALMIDIYRQEGGILALGELTSAPDTDAPSLPLEPLRLDGPWNP